MVDAAKKRALLARENRVRNWAAYGERKLEVRGSAPEIRQLETTSLCNLRCVFCPYGDMTRPKHHMSLEAFREFIGRGDIDHVSEIALHHFGEPFLQSEFPEFVKIATDLGISTVASSNMTRLTEDMARRTLRAGLGRLIVSIDAARPDTYARLRVRGKLEAVEKNLRTLLRIKHEEAAETFIQVQFIATPENASEIAEFEQRWLPEPGIDQVVIRQERTHAGQVVRHDKYEKRMEVRQPCRYLWESLVVLQDGDAVPCCKDFDGKVRLGNVFEKSLSDIWNGADMLALREAHRDGRFDSIPLCSGCAEWRGEAPFAAEEAEEKVVAFERMKSDFRAEPRHMRVWE